VTVFGQFRKIVDPTPQGFTGLLKVARLLLACLTTSNGVHNRSSGYYAKDRRDLSQGDSDRLAAEPDGDFACEIAVSAVGGKGPQLIPGLDGYTYRNGFSTLSPVYTQAFAFATVLRRPR